MKYLLLLPAVALFAVFTAWPLADLVRMSTLKTNFITSQGVGLLNYVNSFREPAFLQSIANSLLYMALMVPAITGGSLLIALMISRLSKSWQDASRILIYLPGLTAGIVIAQVWRWVFHADGPLNWALKAMGLTPVSWWGTGVTSIAAISLIVTMSSFGANTIIMLAAILSIDRSVYEAAKIDGATIGQTNRWLVIPIIWPSILLIAQLTVVQAFQVFESIYALAPYDYAATMAYWIYQQGFQFSKWGLASAQAIVLVVIVAGILLIPKGKRI